MTSSGALYKLSECNQEVVPALLQTAAKCTLPRSGVETGLQKQAAAKQSFNTPNRAAAAAILTGRMKQQTSAHA